MPIPAAIYTTTTTKFEATFRVNTLFRYNDFLTDKFPSKFVRFSYRLYI